MKQLTAILFWLFVFQAASQPARERVILFPDRNLYISGEPIQFSALIRAADDSSVVSRILYCELITADGRRLAGGKYAAVNSIITGNLVIPEELISGVYYMKAYTKAMRNEGPSAYSYDYIKVINPYRNEISAGKQNGAVDTVPDTTTGNSVIFNSIKVPAAATPGEEVRIVIDDPSLCRTLRNFTISVIPGHTLQDRIISPADGNEFYENSFRPETKGILITGIVKDMSGGNVIPAIRVNLSITGEGRDFMSVNTGPDGRFVFPVPDYKGYRDIFLCTESTDSANAQILVDNDFCNLPLSLPAEEFELSDAERETAHAMANRFRLDTYYNHDSVQQIDSVQTPFFYGKPDEILSMEEYVQLPTLEDYFNQLPVPVRVRKRSVHKYFKVLGTQVELMEIDPLVMVDLVVIDDPEKILALDPEDISRIDIVNAVYVKGERVYGGIINIISRQGDFAGISLPASGVFINYSFLSKNIDPGIKSNGPDSRNTVFRKVFQDGDECSGVSFIAPASPGKYMVSVRGADEKGEEVSRTFSFVVGGN